ncbi:putative single-stranded-DNA-specific exonuclease [Actinobacillus pleuropneumoniae]|nr:putative single-stranded-DNA-specific exonuclease [Actinobacillus pleuropneumoniae]KIE92618.1 putative single-stranded-DNA-specific exonuclease [Actinobacillus pleuropneumoniae]KIE92858.1 single-stranded-DNA-specific exonuclease [Actinobacillus pleuropneumoniae]KIE97693.1 putative single-stranded-DNA-specific exonuclease [Actinobacillus pleuropneumoniae]KIE99222.1 putative single-stranded-DNA-specific exonuclease [Actinobacillus pleuropneumoniae]
MQKLIKQRPPLTSVTLSENPLLNRLYQSRGINSVQELERSLQYLYRPQQLANIEQAVSLLIDAFKQQSRIVIVGDFDADGATSTALTILALRQLGFKNVDYLIPDRFSQGYGLSVAVARWYWQKVRIWSLPWITVFLLLKELHY